MPASDRRLDFLAGLALFAATAIAFGPALQGGFVFDDSALVVGNPLLRGPLRAIWFSTEPVDYWPLTYTTFWLEWRAWGRAPLGYHLVNLLLHAGTATLLWWVLRRLRVPGAWLAALLFAVHPVTVESVAWISERKNVLSGALGLSAVLAWLRHRDGAGRRWYVASLVLFLAALLAKTSTVMLPLVMAGIAWRQAGGLKRRDVVGVAPFMALSLALGLVTVWFQAVRSLGGASSGRGLVERIGGAAWAWWSYLWTAAQPLAAAVVYPPWPVAPSSPLFLAPLAGALLLGAVLWSSRWSWVGSVRLALGYHLLMVLPILGLVDLTYFAFSPVGNHLQYLALPGPVALAAAGLAWLRARPRWRAVGLVAAGLAALGLGALTFVRSGAYRDDLTLWTAAEREAPQSLTAAWMHADLLGRAGRSREGIAVLAAAAARLREPSSRLRAQALYLAQTRRFGEALAAQRAAARYRPDPLFDQELAVLLLQDGRFQEAAEIIAPLVELQPRSPDHRYWLAQALLGLGRVEEALTQLREACHLSGGRPGGCAGLVDALAGAGRSGSAASEVAGALGTSPDDPRVVEQLRGERSMH